jgi:hypothetical protein
MWFGRCLGLTGVQRNGCGEGEAGLRLQLSEAARMGFPSLERTSSDRYVVKLNESAVAQGQLLCTAQIA